MTACKAEMFLALSLLVSAAALPAAGVQQQEMQSLRNSDFVFVGTVVETGQASFAGVPASADNLVVKVDGIIEKPSAAMLSAGDEVTVRAQDPKALPAGSRAVFYATSWIYGKGIALAEIGAQAVPQSTNSEEAVRSATASVAQMRTQIENDDLRARIQAADAVVAGVVVSVQPAPAPARMVISEHNPDWQDAIIKVSSVIKGSADLRTVAVRFPASSDVAWYGAPKLRTDQNLVLLLTQDRMSNTPPAELNGSKLPTYTALMPEDVLPEKQLEMVQKAAGRQ